MAKLKPILFNTEMVKALLEGRKTMTRRLIKPQPKSPVVNFLGTWQETQPCANGIRVFPPPYKPGDILYVRETWAPYCINTKYCPNSLLGHAEYCFKASPDSTIYGCVDEFRCRWRPSIHMPKEAARIFLRVKRVSVERLQTIEAAAIRAEGLAPRVKPLVQADFREIWNKTIKPAERDFYGWEANPWVWVIEFERISKEEALK